MSMGVLLINCFVSRTSTIHARNDLGLVDALAQLSFLIHDALAEIAGQHDLPIIGVRLLGVLRDREPTMNALGCHLGLTCASPPADRRSPPCPRLTGGPRPAPG
jgi:hypothetical protein